MKYAFMSFSTPNMSLQEMLETARLYGYDGIEPRLDCGHAHGIEITTSREQRRVIRQQAGESGVELACLATGVHFADPNGDQEMIRQTLARIDLAADVGAPAIRIFGGEIPHGIRREQAIGVLVAALRMVREHALERGVTVCLETHDDWCHPQHVAMVMERVGHPNIAVNWDVMHPVRNGHATIEEAFTVLRPWIRHLHVHDGTAETPLVPIGKGDIDHRRILELLQSIDYDGYLSGEWIDWEPHEFHLPRELAALKAMEAVPA